MKSCFKEIPCPFCAIPRQGQVKEDMNPFGESLRFYARNIESLLIISAITVFPFLLIHNIIMNYVNLITTITGFKIVSGFFNLFLLLLIMTVIQFPFAQFIQHEIAGTDRSLRKALRAFAENGFSLFLFGLVYVLSVTTGMLIFVIPGLIVLVWFYLTPFLMVTKRRSPWKIWREVMDMGKRHFFQIFGVLFLTSVIQALVSMLGLFSVTFITTSYGAVFFTQLLLNVIVFPFIAVLFSMYVQKWSSEADASEGVEEYAP